MGRGPSETFADRLAALKGDVSYHELARRMQAAGLNVTAQGLHKWIALNGGIGLDNLRDVARYFDVSPGWLYFGEEDEPTDHKLDDLSPEARLVAKAWSLLPECYRVPLAMDIFKLAQNQIDENADPRLHFEIKQALRRAVDELTKGL
jgi:hypothetical protein